MNNRFNLLIASFLTLIAAGMGFAIRGGILGDWGAQYGFTKGELGLITGGGLAGFGVIIIICSFLVDTVGYKPLLVIAFFLHVISAVMTLMATPVYQAAGHDATYWLLYASMFLFAIANGICESVINPLVATLYSKQKTHYLNILHAGWPAGLIIGGLFAYFFCGEGAALTHLRWEIPMAVFLVPTVLYGLVVLKEKFPISEARAAGVQFGQMLATFASPILMLLLVLHALIGYVELGTDSWIQDIMKNVIPKYSVLLFIYVSSLMFGLRFFAGPIVERINPVGLLVISSILGCLGLYWLGSATGIAILVAGTVYALGKTFLWPTILGVVGERYPRGGALVMGMMGGVGMLSAGLLGGPGIGFQQDLFAAKDLNSASPVVYERYKAPEKTHFLVWEAQGLDGSKVAAAMDKGAGLKTDIQNLKDKGIELQSQPALASLEKWWDTQAAANVEKDAPIVKTATTVGGQSALRWTALIPLTMAIGFGLLFAYFQMTGGYQAVELRGHHPDGEEFTGGVEGPVR